MAQTVTAVTWGPAANSSEHSPVRGGLQARGSLQMSSAKVGYINFRFLWDIFQMQSAQGGWKNWLLWYTSSSRSLPNNGSIASSKASSPQSAFVSNFQFFPPFLQSHLAVAYVFFLLSPSFYPSLYLSFNNLFQKAVPTQGVTNRVRLSFFLLYDR